MVSKIRLPAISLLQVSELYHSSLFSWGHLQFVFEIFLHNSEQQQQQNPMKIYLWLYPYLPLHSNADSGTLFHINKNP